ncbi:hypothetical protein MTP99_014043 [Tenebrio molitor]|nr:hypothetical protein MTP99_014043 [Tenebrio molitor]
MDVCVCLVGADAGFKSQAGWPPMDVVCCDIRVVSSRKRRGERVGVGSRGKYPGAPPHHKGKKKPKADRKRTRSNLSIVKIVNCVEQY